MICPHRNGQPCVDIYCNLANNCALWSGGHLSEPKLKQRAPSGLGWLAIMSALWIATLLVITMLIIPYARSFGTCAVAPGAPYYSTTNGAEIGRCPNQ